MSAVAINAGSIKIKNIESYGTNEVFNIKSNLAITGNMDITKNLLVLSESDSTDVNTGGFIVKGGIKKCLEDISSIIINYVPIRKNTK